MHMNEKRHNTIPAAGQIWEMNAQTRLYIHTKKFERDYLEPGDKVLIVKTTDDYSWILINFWGTTYWIMSYPFNASLVTINNV